MMESLIHGVGFGFTLSLMVGPVFFGLLQTSINYGFRAGFLYALGVTASDVVIIGFSLTLASTLYLYPNVAYFIKLFGSLAMCFLGIYYFFKKKTSDTDIKIEKSKKSFLFKGFGLNFLTPTVLFFWIATCSFVTAAYVGSPISIANFFAGCFVTVFAIDMLKSFLAIKIKEILSLKIIQKMQQALGLILFAAGLFSLWKIFFSHP